MIDIFGDIEEDTGDKCVDEHEYRLLHRGSIGKSIEKARKNPQLMEILKKLRNI